MPTETNELLPTKASGLSGMDPTAVLTIAKSLPGGIKAGKEAFNDPTLAGFKKKNIVTRGLAGWQTGNKALAEGIFGFDPTSSISAAITGQEYEVGTHIGGEEYGISSKEPEPPKYTTNIDPMTGEEIDLTNRYGKPTPLTMTGNMKPLKMLTGVKGNIPHNMSSKQYNDALKMQEISGAAPLQSNAFYASLNAAKEKGADTFDVGGKTFNVK